MTRGVINKTAVRRECRERGLRVTHAAILTLEELTEEILEYAISNMEECKRTTVMGRDVSVNEVVPK